MVYVERSESLMERKTQKGKLIGIKTKQEAIIEQDKRFKYLNLSLITDIDDEGNEVYFNVSVGNVNFDEMPELKRADDLIKAQKRPMVELNYYETSKAATDENGLPVMEENEEIRDGKTIIVKSPKIYKNFRMSPSDVKKHFKITHENSDAVDQVWQAKKSEIATVQAKKAIEDSKQGVVSKTETKESLAPDLEPEVETIQ